MFRGELVPPREGNSGNLSEQQQHQAVRVLQVEHEKQTSSVSEQRAAD